VIDPDEEYSIFLRAGILTRMRHDECGQLVKTWIGQRSNMKQLIEAMYNHEGECPCRASATE
jgi:hypothetical protein